MDRISISITGSPNHQNHQNHKSPTAQKKKRNEMAKNPAMSSFGFSCQEKKGGPRKEPNKNPPDGAEYFEIPASRWTQRRIRTCRCVRTSASVLLLLTQKLPSTRFGRVGLLRVFLFQIFSSRSSREVRITV